MSKAIMLTILVTAIMASVLLCGCEEIDLGGQDTEEVITEEKDFTDFTYVDVGSAFEVEITRLDTFSVIISADESLFDYIEVSKTGDTLKISLKPRHIFTDFTIGAKTLKTEITMPALYGLELSGASKGIVTGFKSSEDFNLDVSGASSLEMADFEAGDAEFEVSGASKVAGNMNADDVKLEVSGASVVELEGEANNIILDIAGASTIDLTNFPLDNADVNLSGASKATIHVSGKLDTVLSGASSLYFYGNPVMGNINVSGASTVKHK